MLELEGFILVGGASSRMGTDKAQLRLGGQTFVERINNALSSITERVFVVSAKSDRASSGLPSVADVYRGCGALGGLHAALAHASADWVVVVSCDLPFVTGELFARLASLRGEGFEAVAPVQADGRPQPLCAVYAREPCLRVAEQMLQTGEFRPRVLLGRVRTRWVSPAELADLDGATLFFTNVNTPEDYARARARAGDRDRG